MVSTASLVAALSLASGTLAGQWDNNLIYSEASAFFVSNLAAYKQKNINDQQASSVAGHLFDVVAGDPALQAGVSKALANLSTHAGTLDGAEIRALASIAGETFNNYKAEPAYTQLLKFAKQHMNDFDFMAIAQQNSGKMASLAAPYSSQAIQFLQKVASDPNGKAALQTGNSIARQIFSDFIRA